MKYFLIFVIASSIFYGGPPALDSAGFPIREMPQTLINQETGHIVIEFMKGKVRFCDRFLEVEMRETGIHIPPSKRVDFDGKEVVYFNDPAFEKAFIEVYAPFFIANSLYQWH